VEHRIEEPARLVGRRPELDRLRRLFERADGVGIGLVGGEAGIGKTRLVREALTGVDPATVRWLQGDPTRRVRPFGVLVDALEADVRDWDELPAALAPRRRAVCALLGPVAPRLVARGDAGADVDPAAMPGPGDEPVTTEELERAAVDLLRHLAPDTGRLVLVADDLHWIDPDTVVFLHHLALGVPGLDDLVVLGTYRVDELLARSPLAALLSTVERHPEAVNVRLDRLGPDEVAEFASAAFGADVPYRAVKALHHRSGGNPFFLGELVAMAQDSGVEAIADLPLPWTVAEALRDAVQTLDDRERAVVETAAVLGHRVSFDLLGRVAGLDESALIACLRPIVAAGLLVEEEIDVFVFRHALVRESIEHGLLGRERRRVHEAALTELLAADEPDHVAVARHARGAGRIDVLRDAVRVAAAEALQAGSAHQALDLAEFGLAEVPDDTVLGAVATRAAWLVGALGDAAVHGARWAAAAAREGGASAEAAARRLLVRIAVESGDEVAQRRERDRLVALVEELTDPGERSAALVDLAQSEMLLERIEVALEVLDRAEADAAAAGSERVLVQARIERSSIDARLGRPEAIPEMLDAVARAEELGEHLHAARGLNNVADLLPMSERRAHLDRMKAAAERAGFAFLASTAYAHQLADLASLEADRAELERQVADSWRWRPSGDGRGRSLWFRYFEALLLAESTDPAMVVPHRTPTHLPETGTTADVIDRYVGLLHAARAGDAAGAADLVRAIAGLSPDGLRPKVDDCDASPVATVVDAALRAGVAPSTLQELLGPFEGATDHARLAAGLLAAADGDRTATEAAMATVGDDVEAWLRAEGWLRVAELALRSGDPEAAATHAHRSRHLLVRWPGRRRDRADALLRRLERRGLTDDGHDLSARELEVVGLLVEGLTNAEIAERLYIARKTAAVHVSNILTKLGLRSRGEVAAWAVRTGVVAVADRRAG
jgi:DNA-binding CsgD family transcriptional regulator